MEKAPGYDCPHGHSLYGKCLLCEREAQSKEPTVAELKAQLAAMTAQRDLAANALRKIYGFRVWLLWDQNQCEILAFAPTENPKSVAVKTLKDLGERP